jgi:hypothetical protein
MEKMVALAPTPNPMDTITATQSPGDLENRRKANRMSCMMPPAASSHKSMFAAILCRYELTHS